MYLKQKGLKISGSKAELIDRVLTHAHGNLQCQRCCRRRGISQFMQRRHNQVEFSDSDDYSNDSSMYVQESFEVMFVLEEEIQRVN